MIARKEEFIEKFKKNSLTQEDVNYLVDLIEKEDERRSLKIIEFPEQFEVNLGYEDSDAKYIICENKEEIDVFNEPVLSEYILFMVKDGKFIAVDGGTKRNTWAIPETFLA